MSIQSLQSATLLRSGVAMPLVGLGVFRAGSDGATARAVRSALDAGYRHIDTAAVYRNEAEVGEALRVWCAETGHRREEVFVTTKLWNDDQGHDPALRAFERSATRLGVEVVDQYLLHWPVPGRRLDSWRALERLHAEGRVRSIGVSNFTEAHLDELIAQATVLPDTNQVELHPFLAQPALVAACRARGVQPVAYSPLTKGRNLEDPRILAVAGRVRRTPAQVLIRWGLQQGHVVLPKSSDPGRIAQNAAVFDFELDADALSALAGLDRGLRTAWDPTQVP